MGCNNSQPITESSEEKLIQCSLVTNDEEYLLSEWQESEKLVIGIGKLECQESLDLKMDFQIDSLGINDAIYFLIPETEEFKVGVITESIFHDSINSRIQVASNKRFQSPIGASQIVAMISMPNQLNALDPKVIGIKASETECRKGNSIDSKCKIEGKIDFFVNVKN